MNYQKFPFGKYKGVNIYELPTNYIVHALQTFEMPQELEAELAEFAVLGLKLHCKNYVRFTKDIKKTFENIKQRYNNESVDVLLEILSNELNINAIEYTRLEMEWKLFMDKLNVNYEYIKEVGFKVKDFGGGGILIANADVERHQIIATANKYQSDIFICGDSPDFLFYRAYSYKDKGFYSLTFCGGDSNYKNISGRFIDPEENAGMTIQSLYDMSENDWFWSDYITAVLYIKSLVK